MQQSWSYFDFLSSKSLTSFEITTWMLESLKIYVQRLFWIQNNLLSIMMRFVEYFHAINHMKMQLMSNYNIADCLRQLLNNL